MALIKQEEQEARVALWACNYRIRTDPLSMYPSFCRKKPRTSLSSSSQAKRGSVKESISRRFRSLDSRWLDSRNMCGRGASRFLAKVNWHFCGNWINRGAKRSSISFVRWISPVSSLPAARNLRPRFCGKPKSTRFRLWWRLSLHRFASRKWRHFCPICSLRAPICMRI